MHDDQGDNPSTSASVQLFGLFVEIGIIDQLIQNEADRLLAPDLNMPQFSLLSHLVRTGRDSSLVQLARAMQVTKGAMTNTVGRLADKGLVSVQPDPMDKRGKRVSLTGAGLAAHGRAVVVLSKRIDPLLGPVLSPDQVQQARATLTSLRQWLDANRPA